MSNVKCVPMNDSHIDQVYEINCMSFNSPWSIDSIYQELFYSSAKYVVALWDGKVVGFGGMWLILDEAHITNIAVHPQFRHMGVGAKILNSLVEICTEANIVAMTLEVRVSNTNAQKLYENFGFKAEGLRKKFYSDNHEDCLIMWKRF